MATVDSLDIRISAEVNKANASIELLSKKLDRLSASLSGVNSRGLATLGAGVNKLSGAMANFYKNTKTADFSRLARNLESISRVDTSKFSDISSKMSSLSGSFSGFGSVDVSGITSVAGALSKLGGKNAVAGADNLLKMKNSLEQFVSGMNSVGNLTFDTSSLSGLLSSISKLGGKTATEAAKNLLPISENLLNFVRQLNKVGSLNFDVGNLSSLVSAISRLGGKGATGAAENLPKLAVEINNLMQTLSKAPKVSQNVIQMANALAALARTGRGSGTAADSLSKSLTKMSNTATASSGKVKKAFAGMQNNFKNVFRSIAPFIGAYELISFGKKAMEISSNLTEVQNVVDVTFGNMAYKVEEFAETSIEKFGMSELSLKQFSSRFQAMGAAMGISPSIIGAANDNLSKLTNGYVSASDSMSDMSLSLTKLTADMASFYNIEQEAVAQDLESIFTGMTRPLRTYGLDLTEATLKEWALKQGLDADMESMSQAEKTMLRYQYVMANTTAAQGDFARTADTWANQIRILKQNFEQLASIIGGNLVNAFKPVVKAVNAALGSIINFAKAVSEALGTIFGWKYEEGGGGLAQDFGDAEDAAGGIVDSTGEAAKNIDKMRKGLRAFDELNVIETPEPSDGSGGGGAGAGAGAIGGMIDPGKWVQGEGLLKAFESEIDTLYKLGEYIGNTLSKAMEGIKWEDVYKKARNFGKGLANFLNGLISPRLFGNVGATIANSLNTALEFLNSFGTTFDWKDFGDSIATGINNFFKKFKFNKLAKTINTWANGLLDTMITAITKTDWEAIGKSVGDFVSKIKWGKILKNIGKLIWEAINAAVKAWSGLFDSSPFLAIALNFAIAIKSAKSIKNIYDGVEGFFAKIKEAFRTFSPAMSTEVSASGASISKLFIAALSPEGALIGAGLIASLAVAAVKLKQGMETLEIFNAAREVSDRIKEILTEIDEIEISFKADIESADVAYETTRRIAEKYFELSDSYNSLNDSQKALLKAYAEDLAETMPEIAGEIDKTTGVFKGQKDEVYNAISAMREYAKEAAKVDYLKELYGMQIKLNGEIEKAQSEYNEASDELERLSGKHDLVSLATYADFWQLKELSKEEKEAIQKYKEARTSLDVLKDSYYENNLAIAKVDGSTNALTYDTEKAGDSIQKYGDEKLQGVIEKMNGVEGATSGTKDGINDMSGAMDNAGRKAGEWSEKLGDLREKILDVAKSMKSAAGKGLSAGALASLTIFPQYAVGGFPEDGWFRASHGEIMGRFDNGKSVVANNNQITEGIADAVYPAVYNAVSSAMKNSQGSQSPEIRVFIGDREITDVAIDGITERTIRAHKTPFPLY